MKNKLLEFIRTNRRVFFSEIEQFFKECKYPYEGDRPLLIRESSNILIWTGWTKEACDLLVELCNEGEIGWSPATTLETAIMPIKLKFPLAVQCEHDYKKPHWIPSVIDLLKEGETNDQRTV